jgi:hypothetical protein
MSPELQRLLCRALLHPESDPPALAALAASPRLAPAAQLALYRSSIVGSMTRALAATYPVCARLVGEAFFGALASAYIEAHPSRSPDLNDYGAGLAGFLEQFAPARPLPYLPDVARLEWLWQQVFNGPDAPTLTLAAVAAWPEDERARVRLRRPPASGVLASRFPVDRIWEVNQDDYPGEPAADLAGGPVRLCVWRCDRVMRLQAVSDVEWMLLEVLADDRSLAEICGRLAPRLDEDELSALLVRALDQGWMTTARNRPIPEGEPA